MKIVIAGKNQCAVDAHKYVKRNYPQHELIGIPNSDDDVYLKSINYKEVFRISSERVYAHSNSR